MKITFSVLVLLLGTSLALRHGPKNAGFLAQISAEAPEVEDGVALDDSGAGDLVEDPKPADPAPAPTPSQVPADDTEDGEIYTVNDDPDPIEDPVILDCDLNALADAPDI